MGNQFPLLQFLKIQRIRHGFEDNIFVFQKTILLLSKHTWLQVPVKVSFTSQFTFQKKKCSILSIQIAYTNVFLKYHKSLNEENWPIAYKMRSIATPYLQFHLPIFTTTTQLIHFISRPNQNFWSTSFFFATYNNFVKVSGALEFQHLTASFSKNQQCMKCS